MAKPPILEVEATFLARDEGGRIQPPDLDAGRYMPHLVVRPAGIRATDDGLTEDYLGVAFLEGPRPLVAGRPGRFVVELMYHPRVDYDALREGAPFSIREGGRVVGYGEVVRRLGTTDGA